MKRFIIGSLVLAMLTGISVSAADGGKGKKGAHKPSAEALKKHDKNNDGKIDKSDNLTKEEKKAYRQDQKNATPEPATPTAPAAPAPAK
jgi:hypothetical protein